ncbi:MAG: hypothetical protein ACRDQZ_21780 [Mycobacteriales bacterium]
MKETTRILTVETWQDPQIWSINHPHAHGLFGLRAFLISEDHVRGVIAAAIEDDDELLPYILHGIAHWIEIHHAHPGVPAQIVPRIDELPAWLPTDHIVTAIRKAMPTVQPAQDEDDESPESTEQLAAHVLRLAASD